MVHFAKIDNFSPYNPKDTSDYKHFIQTYYELYLASYNNKGMKPFQELKQQVKELKEKGVIPIGVLNYKFNYIDSEALNNSSLIIKNKQLYINENSELEYTKQAESFVPAILSNKLISR